MKKLLLASTLAIVSFPGFSNAKPITQCDIDSGECAEIAGEPPPARVCDASVSRPSPNRMGLRTLYKLRESAAVLYGRGERASRWA
jgi:hypothetical protein